MKLNQLNDMGVGIAIGIGLIAIAGYISSRYLGDDNIVEEIGEEAFKYETGLDVDFTPNTPEKK